MFVALVAYRLCVIVCSLLPPDSGVVCIPDSFDAHPCAGLFSRPTTRYSNRKSTVLLIKFGLLFYGVTRVAQLAILVALFCFYDLSDPMLSFGTKVFAIGGCSILMVMPKDYIFRIKASHSSVTPHLYFESKTVRAN